MSRSFSRPSRASAVTFLVIVVLALAEGGSSQTAIGVATAAIWLAVVVSVLVRRDQPAFASRVLAVVALLIGLLALTVLSLSWGPDDGAAFLDAVRLSGYAGVAVFAGLHLRRGDGRGLFTAITLAALTIALVALASRLGGIGSGDEALAELVPLAAGRLSFPIGYWNALGALMALAIPALVYLASVAKAGRVGMWIAAGVPMILTAHMAQSRGALLAALIGAGVVIAATPQRRRPTVALAVVIVAALPACIAASFATGIRDTAGDGVPGGAEALVAVALLIGVVAAIVAGGPLMERLGRAGSGRARIRVRPAIAIPAALAAVIAAIAVAGGPGVLFDEFNSLPDEPRTSTASGLLSTSGSGRAQFWETALEAYAEEPVRGIGAGGFATFWNVNGSLGTPVRDVHSAPLEYLAELGIAGVACFLAIFAVAAVAGVRRTREPGGNALAAAALGILAAGFVGYLIDFTWHIPAVSVVTLVIVVALAGPVFDAEPAAAGPPPVPVPGPILALGAVALAMASIWAGGVLAIAGASLDESREAQAAGDGSRAAAAARDAIAVEPWAAEPWLQLAGVEESVGNLSAARRAVKEAIERSPNDFRGWLLISVIEAKEGEDNAAVFHAFRATALAPLVLQRLPEFVTTGP